MARGVEARLITADEHRKGVVAADPTQRTAQGFERLVAVIQLAS